MTKKIITKETELAGRKLVLETGRLAKQAESAVLATWGETVVLVTVATKPITEDPGYFPLSVEYVEKYYAGGRITAQKFIKRETRPSDKAVLSARAVDRAIRPLFPKDFRNEVQVIITTLSFDGLNNPAVLGFIGTSAALAISAIPWDGPIGVCHIGVSKGQVSIFPNLDEEGEAELTLVVSSTKEKVMMIEAQAKQIDDKEIFSHIKTAHEEQQQLIDFILSFIKEVGIQKHKPNPISDEIGSKLLSKVQTEVKESIEKALFDKDHTWHESTTDFIKQELALKYSENLTPVAISYIFDKAAKEIMNEVVLKKGKRVDGRAMDEVRDIQIVLGLLPRTHGSALFQRGDTQVLSVATLGPLSASQTLEGMEGERLKRFMHHYNMSINPFSTGDVKRIGAPNRRDIGHGDLVERSITGVLPKEEDFPYAVRVVSEVLAANASTSMASVCASTLALLNAGVDIEPVAGIALGLLSDSESGGEKFQIITDMQAVEDFYGEMDFKIAGTKSGITGIQMDTKLHGLTFAIIEEALNDGKKAREFILEKIHQAAPEKKELSKYAPKIKITHIKPEEIGLLIGSGGKTINGLIARTGAQIDIEDDGTVMISSTNEESISQALAAVEGMFKSVNMGDVFDGKVTKITNFGAFVEIAPGKEGLVHISQIAPYRVNNPEDIVSLDQVVHVRVTSVDPQGKVGLSMLFGDDRKPDLERRPMRQSGFRNQRFSRNRR